MSVNNQAWYGFPSCVNNHARYGFPSWDLKVKNPGGLDSQPGADHGKPQRAGLLTMTKKPGGLSFSSWR